MPKKTLEDTADAAYREYPDKELDAMISRNEQAMKDNASKGALGEMANTLMQRTHSRALAERERRKQGKK